MKVKDLTEPQRKLWRAARAYAKAEVDYQEENYAWRSTGDSAMKPLDGRRLRAANRLLSLIAAVDA